MVSLTTGKTTPRVENYVESERVSFFGFACGERALLYVVGSELSD